MDTLEHLARKLDEAIAAEDHAAQLLTEARNLVRRLREQHDRALVAVSASSDSAQRRYSPSSS
jgi:beta-phosphoglucomutase-like phosphatase (HAD superfamily)